MFSLLTCFQLILCLTPGVAFLDARPGISPGLGDPVRTVVIDPGHGGSDPGCLGGHAQEKEITLRIARLLKKQINTLHPEVKVVLTRDKDVFVPLHTRSSMANEAKADLFISLHCNALPPSAKSVSGSETYVLGLHRAQDNFEVAQRENAAILLEDNHQLNYGDFDPNSAEAYILMAMYQNAYLEKSIVFADLVENAIVEHGGRSSKGVKQAGFLVLRENAMPSVLIETGFLTNASDEAFLSSEQGQQLMAESLATAFSAYKSLMETGKAVASKPGQPSGKAVASTSNSSVEQPKPSAADVTKPAPKEKPAAAKPEGPVSASPRPTVSSSGKESTIQSGVWYGIQLGAFKETLPAGHQIRKDVPKLLERKENGFYKYLAGPFASEEEADKVKKSLLQSGYKGIFTVSYRGEERLR